MTTNPYSKGLDDVAKSIWHEPGEKPNLEATIVFLCTSHTIKSHYRPNMAWNPNIPWCYEEDLARMLNDMRKAEEEPKAKLEWEAVAGVEIGKDGTPKVTVKKCTLEETKEGLKFSEIEVGPKPSPCNKCKGYNSLLRTELVNKSAGLYVVRCYNCNQSTFGETFASTIAAWNERQKEKERQTKSPSLDPFTGHVTIPPTNITVTGEAKPAASALDRQVGGRHYKSLAIQPVEYIEKNKIPYTEGCVIKYVTRHREKGGADDLKKAIHFIEMLLEREYPKAAKTAG